MSGKKARAIDVLAAAVECGRRRCPICADCATDPVLAQAFADYGKTHGMPVTALARLLRSEESESMLAKPFRHGRDSLRHHVRVCVRGGK